MVLLVSYYGDKNLLCELKDIRCDLKFRMIKHKVTTKMIVKNYFFWFQHLIGNG